MIIGILISLSLAVLGYYQLPPLISALLGIPTPPSRPPHFEIADYLGNWVNANPQMGGITHIEVRDAGGKPTVQMWGKCHPTDCDWGSVDATPFGSNVESRSVIISLGATFKPNFAERQVTLHLIEKNVLRATVSTHFTDRSDRSDYEKTETFRRSTTS
jgi:hypothetical protein